MFTPLSFRKTLLHVLRSSIFFYLGACLLLCGIAQGQTTFYIDNNGATAGFGWAAGTNATWNATNTNWTSSVAGTNATVSWDAIGGGSSTVVGLNGTVSTSTVIIVGNFTIAGLTKNGTTTNISISGNNSLTFSPGAFITGLTSGQYITFTDLSPIGDFTSNGTGSFLRFTKAYTGNITASNELQWNNSITSTGANVNLIGSGSLNVGNAGANLIIGNLSGNSTSAVANANGRLTVTQTRDETFLGTIAGTRIQGVVTAGQESNFTKNGSATLALGGNNTYVGATIVNAGTLSIATIANSGIRFTGNYLASNATVTANSTAGLSVNMTVASASATARQRINSISGANLTLSATVGGSQGGNGVVTLAGFANGLGLSTSNATNLQIGNGTLRYTGVTASTDRDFTLINGTTASIDVSQAGTTLTMSGSAVASTGGLNKLGNGTLVFSGNHSYTGATTISAGTLSIANIANGSTVSGLGNSTSAAANLVLNGGTLNYTGASASSNRSFTLANSTSSGIAVADNSTLLTLSGNSASTSGSITKVGGGTLALTGNNSYSGGTTISAGTLQVGHANALGTSGNITFSGGTMSFDSSGNGADYGARIKNSGSAIILDTNGQSVTFAGAMDSSNAGGLTKNGTGTLTLSAANTYSGGTTINAGTLAFGASGALGSGNVAVASSAALELVASSGTTTLSNNISGSGTIRQTGSGTTSLTGTNTNTGAVEATAGTLFFSGAGALSASTASLNASNSATLSLADGTTRNSTIAGNIDLSGSSFLKFDINGASSDFLSANGTASLSGTGKIQLNLLSAPSSVTTYNLLYAGGGLTSNWTLDTNSFAAGAFNWNLATVGNYIQLTATASSTNTYWLGASSGNWSTLANWAAGADGSGSGVLPQAGYNVFFDSATASGNLTTTLGGQDYTLSTLTISKPEVTINGSNTLNVTTSALSAIAITATGNTTINANLAGAAGLTKSNDGTLTLGGNNSFTGGASITGGTLILSGGLNNSSVTVDGGALNQTSTGTIAGASSTFTLSSGNATLAGNNTYGGATTITLGTLEVATTGSLGGGSYAQNIANNGTFIYSGANNQTLSGIISGSGVLTQNGSSTLTLAGNNTYSGATTITAGTLEIASTGRLGGGSYAQNIVNNGAFIYSGTNNQTLSGIISGSGALTQNASSILTLFGNNTYSGATTINAGTLEIASTGRLGGGNYAQNIANNGAFIYSGANNQALSGVISGSGALTHNASSTLTLSGNNIYSGATTINAGTLEVATTGRLGGGNYAQNIVNNGAFIYSGTNNQTLSGIISGSGLLTHNSSSTLTLGGNNTYSGATTINAGTLQIGAGGTTGSLNTSSAITNNGTLAFNRSNTVTQGTDFMSVLSGAGNLIQAGSGNLILTGNNTYSGGTTINAGTLEISSTGRLGGGSYAQNIVNNGALIYSGTNSQVLSGVLSGSGALTQNNSSSTLTLAGSNTYSGNTTVSAGVLRIQHANALGSTNNGTVVTNGASVQLQGGITVASETLTLNGPGQGSVGALRSVSGSNEWAGNIVIGLNNTRIYSDIGASLTISGNITNNGDPTTQVIFGNQGNGTVLVSGTIGGNGRLVITADGVTLAENNNFSGSTSIQGGTVSIGSIKDVGAGASSLGNPDTSLNGRISLGTGASSGGIRYTGSGDSSNRTIALEGSTGGAIIDHSGTGTLKFTSNFTAPLNGNKTLVLQGSTTGIGEIGGAIPDNTATFLTSLTKNGTGTWILSGNNTYSGATTINAGTLQIGNGNSTGSLSINSTIINNATLAFNRSNSVIQGTHFSSNGVSGTGNLTQSGSGNLILNAVNTYSGTTTINSGTLVIGNTNALGSSSVVQSSIASLLKIDTTGTVTNNMSVYNVQASQNATLSGAITVNNATWEVDAGDTLTVSGAVSGSGGITKNGTGTLILSGNNSFTGATAVNTGTLRASATGALGSTSSVAVNGGSLLVTAENAINNSADITLGGGTLAVSGTSNQSVGLLTLSADSIIDLNGFTGTLRFGGVGSWASSTNLAIWNWNGINQYNTPVGDGLNTRHVVFTDSSGLSSYLNRISFYSDNGSSFAGNGFEVGFSGGGTEIIAVPEPETCATAGILLLAGILVQWIKRRQLTPR